MICKAAATFLSLIAALPAYAQEKPIQVTSDTEEYCSQLQSRIVRGNLTVEDVQRLLAEGRAMCDHGEIRGGIVRLRRALGLQKNQAKSPHS
jgi:hypothetical protein